MKYPKNTVEDQKQRINNEPLLHPELLLPLLLLTYDQVLNYRLCTPTHLDSLIQDWTFD